MILSQLGQGLCPVVCDCKRCAAYRREIGKGEGVGRSGGADCAWRDHRQAMIPRKTGIGSLSFDQCARRFQQISPEKKSIGSGVHPERENHSTNAWQG